ncbi:dienelactone hydrolase family protein [Homoserinibacter sp. YIM 151385]|uniref:dienelactone hydrolase family protein n=1 Tax=Homoserinibacter sp. YIM 151385 TaxID=2985506 RepID=UPI0022F10DC3|nr:dienelactone hydrolase family protein [Homoserinibacter sp. YIM 151385]WBU37289.1 dienelactone hydrolase family protein [Homoserinibacter sp. YIM 151385]
MDDALIPLPSPGIPLVYGEEGRPLAVVVHDMYGRLPWLESYGAALADRAGLRVVVLDLYGGIATAEEREGARLMDELLLADADEAIDGAIREARAQGTTRVGLVGFAMGGWMALRHAQTGQADAVVAYAAALEQSAHTVIPCPVLLHLAEYDEWPEGDGPEVFTAALKDHGTPVTVHRYLGTQHSFANASLPERVDRNAAALAFARTAVFLEQQLDG